MTQDHPVLHGRVFLINGCCPFLRVDKRPGKEGSLRGKRRARALQGVSIRGCLAQSVVKNGLEVPGSRRDEDESVVTNICGG